MYYPYALEIMILPWNMVNLLRYFKQKLILTCQQLAVIHGSSVSDGMYGTPTLFRMWFTGFITCRSYDATTGKSSLCKYTALAGNHFPCNQPTASASKTISSLEWWVFYICPLWSWELGNIFFLFFSVNFDHLHMFVVFFLSFSFFSLLASTGRNCREVSSGRVEWWTNLWV